MQNLTICPFGNQTSEHSLYKALGPARVWIFITACVRPAGAGTKASKLGLQVLQKRDEAQKLEPRWLLT